MGILLNGSLEWIVDQYAEIQGSRDACVESYTGGGSRSYSYENLREVSILLAHGLQKSGLSCAPTQPEALTPLGVCMIRGFNWYALYIACIRLGLPIVPMVQDHTGLAEQERRNRDILVSLSPCAVIIDDGTPSSVVGHCDEIGIKVLNFNRILSLTNTPIPPLARLGEKVLEATPLAYLYTGGTTGASKCAIVSHQMAMHEMKGYPLITSNVGRDDRVIQHSSTIWGATFLGQINIALAFGASLVFCDNEPDLSEVIERERISVLGLVPSKLNAITRRCDSIKVVFTWGEKMSRKTASKWKSKCVLIELLVSTEYWLCLYALHGEDEFRILNLPSVDLVVADSLLHVGGECVTPFGYTSCELNNRVFVTVNGKRYFKTSDSVLIDNEKRKVKYLGRSDSMIKIGGEWRDTLLFQEKLLDIDGVDDVRIVKQRAFIVLGKDFTRECIDRIRMSLPGEEYIQLHFVSHLPRITATGKVDDSALLAATDGAVNPPSKASRRRINRTSLIWLLWLSLSISPLLISGRRFFLNLPTAPVLYLACPPTDLKLTRPGIALLATSILSLAIPWWVQAFLIICIGYFTGHTLGYLGSWIVTFYLGLGRHWERVFSPSYQQTQRDWPWIAFPAPELTTGREWQPRGDGGNDKQMEAALATFDHDNIQVSESEANELGKALPPHVSVAGVISGAPLEGLGQDVADIVEAVCHCKVGSGDFLLTNLNSLQAVEVTNLLRDSTKRDVHVSDILRSVTIGKLAELLESKPQTCVATKEIFYRDECSYRCQLWGWSFPCVWVFEYTPGRNGLYMGWLFDCLKKLAKRHPTLLACPDSRDREQSGFLNELLVVIGLVRYWLPGWVAQWFGRCVYANWYRISILEEPKFKLRRTDFQSEKEMRDHILWTKQSRNFDPPTQVELMVVAGERFFVRMYVTHAFSDGSSVIPLLKDLDALYTEKPLSPSPSLNGLQIQERRLAESLTARDLFPDSFYLCYSMDQGDCSTCFGRIVILHESFVFVVQAAANRLSVPLDVLFLSAIALTLARLNGIRNFVEMALVVPLRDGPHEADVVGFFADQRNLDIPLTPLATLASVVQTVHALRRARAWKIPEPFTNSERTLVNIVQANFPPNFVFRQELLVHQKEFAVGTLSRPMELYVEQVDVHMWSLKARCRLREYSPDKFVAFCSLFKRVVFDILADPNSPV